MSSAFIPAWSARPRAEILHYGVENHRAGRLQAAEAAYRHILATVPDDPDTLYLLGLALHGQGNLAAAEESCRTALRLRPDFLEARIEFAGLLAERGLLEAAEQSYRAALALAPNRLEIHQRHGSVLNRLERWVEAEASCHAAIAVAPDRANSWYNLGLVQYRLGRLAEAEAAYRTAIGLQPDHQMAHYNLGHILLVTGRLAEGWPHSEWQAVTHAAGLRDFAAPLWDGAPLGGGVLLLHAEQGLGDTLQFCRYAPLLGSGAELVLEVQPLLVRLLQTLPGVGRIVARGDPLPDFAAHAPLAALPRLLGTVLETIPAAIPYLAADPGATASWRARLAGLPGRRVGLVWAGRADPTLPQQIAMDRRRSLTLDRLALLGDVAGVSFVSLQKGEPAVQAVQPPAGLVVHDVTADLHDFADTAALVAALDLVIGVDTAVVHLAGALGKPVWLLNRFDTCWRWLLERDDSPWYPTLRQFRQPVAGDWDSVVAAVRSALIAVADDPAAAP